ncbi:helix-turn-helix domain-containing protein [Lacticaseibacillus suibinensis]|uniref:helix-turn-helix domain-containing protein n=1 Tax=Lacticaseibacillus suibinensis TaxID=2486011 RepID=UPI000F7A793C|nr:helix-turn-helix transcriptional regulator [Lacticaseibacillus suibinensis]
MIENISKLIRSRRKRLGLTIEQLAEEAGVSVSLLSRVERGDVTNISIKKLAAIGEALGLKVSDFFVAEDFADIDTLALINLLKGMPAEQRQAVSAGLVKAVRALS